MNVCHEMFGPLGQIQDSFEIDNLGRGGGNIRETLCEQLQYAQISLNS